MPDEGVRPVCEILGVRPWGERDARPIHVYEGDVFHVGRLDKSWLKKAGLQHQHLALGPATRATVSVMSLTLLGAQASVEVSTGHKVIDALVDGNPVGRDPIVLHGPSHEIVIDPAGVPQVVRIRFLGGARGRTGSDLHSGSTVVPDWAVTEPRLQRMAAALAWPLLPDTPPPLAEGWSTEAVASRYAELFGEQPNNARRLLFDLRDSLVEARAADGRPMSTIPEVAPWPWHADFAESGFVTRQGYYEAQNRLTAMYLVATHQVDAIVAAALDRIR